MTKVKSKDDVSSHFLPTKIVLHQLHREVLPYRPLVHPITGLSSIQAKHDKTDESIDGTQSLVGCCVSQPDAA